MVSTQPNLSELKITVDSSKVNFNPLLSSGMRKLSQSLIHCSCQTEFCECGSTLGVTEAAAKKVYQHFGYPAGRNCMKSEGFGLETVLVWGTQDLSTTDILKWLSDYHPKQIEWIDDHSCKVHMPDENTALRLLTRLGEPFDRRIALTAMAAVASVISLDGVAPLASPTDIFSTSTETRATSTTVISTVEESMVVEGEQTVTISSSEKNVTDKVTVPAGLPRSFSTGSIKSIAENMPSSGRWFKSVASPERTFCLFLRFAHKSDVKLPGAERRSEYYKRYGNPNYGGMVGLLSRSFRRRTRNHRQQAGAADNGAGDLRRIRLVNGNSGDQLSTACCGCTSGETRALITYDDLYDDDKFVDDSDDLDDLARDFDEGLISVHNETVSGSSRQHTGNLAVPVFLCAGRRREAAACGFNPSKHPRKWSRRDRVDNNGHRFILPDFKVGTNLREPWSGELSNNDFSGFRGSGKRLGAKQRLGVRPPVKAPLATITLLPDTDTEKPESHRLLTSMRMVADLEEENIFGRTKSGMYSSSASTSHHQNPSERRNPALSRNVWTRLG